MINRKFLLVILTSLFISDIFGQDHVTSYAASLQEKTPLSPNAASIGRYLDFQVNMATGVPNIQIPIYTIKSGNITIPITLSYHAGGVKVNDKAGWVGLGWNLSPGGTIVKKTNGLDDIYLTTGYSAGTPDQDYLHPNYTNVPYNPGYANMTDAVEGFMNSDVGLQLDSNLRFMGRILVSQNDGEADDFFYTTPQGSAKFYYNQKLEKFQTNKINGDLILGDTTEWTISSSNGINFSFGQRETTFNPLYQMGQSSQQSFITTWHMTGISDLVNKKGVSFDYDNYYTTDVYNGVPESNDYTFDTYGILHLYAAHTQTNKRTGDNYVLKTIRTENETINFVKDTAVRQDDPGPHALKEIQIYDKDSLLLKKYLFSYYYSVADTGWSLQYGATDKRLILGSLQEINYTPTGDSIINPAYNFKYDTTIKLPCRLSYAQDKWGYYNGKLANITTIPHNPYFATYSSIVGANRDIDSNYVKAGTLNKIQYPTGGTAFFEYESNRDDTVLYGGLRVKRITYFDSVAQSSVITEYNYPGLYTSWTPPFWYLLQHLSNFYIYGNEYYFDFTPVFRVEGEPIAPSFLNQGSPGVYSLVERVQKSSDADLKSKHYFHTYNEPMVFYENIMGVPHPKVAEISDIFEYQTEIYKKEPGGSYTLIQKDSSNYGSIENTEDYIWNVKGAWNWNQDEWCEWPGGDPFIYGVGYMIFNISPSIQAYKEYPFQYVKADHFIKTITETGYLKQASSYEYDSTNGNIKITRSIDSKGDTTIQLLKYAADYLHTGAVSGNNYQVDMLLDSNYLAAPIEVLTLLKKKDSTNSVLQDATLYEYDDLRIKKIYKVYEDMPFASFDESYNDISGFYKDSHYTLYQEITAFDGEQNPRTLVVSGNKESYIWDGDNMLSKTANAAYDEIAFSSFETSQKGNWNYSGTPVDTAAITGKKGYQLSGGNITVSSLSNIPYVVSYWSKDGAQNVNSTSYITGRTVNGWTYYEHVVTPGAGLVTVSGTGLIDELRLYPKDALMTTYTYENLKGLSSQCDASNRIQYYEYGAGTQLKSIKDEDGRILKRFDYKYQGTNQD